MMKKNILILYQYMRPDDVVSAQIFSDAAESLSDTGHTVEAWPVSASRTKNVMHKQTEFIQNVYYNRITRRYLNQDNNLNRLISSFTVQGKWVIRYLFNRKKFNVILIGTDPIFSSITLILLKLINPKVKIIYWIFDLHPEASTNLSPKGSTPVVSVLEKLNNYAFSLSHKSITIGSCMENLLRKKYSNFHSGDVITPWSLVETNSLVMPSTFNERISDYTGVEVVVMYSGNYGRAHNLNDFLNFILFCSSETRISFCIAGSAQKDLKVLAFIRKHALTNIKFMGLADQEELLARLQIADYHWVSIRKNFSGIVVPSKFFGSLAVSRPVIVNSDYASSLRNYVDDFGVGYWLPIGSDTSLFTQLRDNLLQKNKVLVQMKNAYTTHTKYFSKAKITKKLTKIIGELEV